MTYPDPTNPYASPPPAATAIAPGPTFKPIEKIEHLRMYKYIFENPNWLMNILQTAVCMLIPVIGGLVAMGYQFEVFAALLATQGARYPDFNFNKFSDYLMRGLWPFLVQLVASLVLTPVVMIVLLVPMMIVFGVAGAAGEDAAPVIMILGFSVFGLFAVVASVLLTMVYLPPVIRAGLAQDFVEGFNFGWAVDFLKKTCKELFVALLFLIFSAGLLTTLGLLACYVGIFVAMPLVFLAQAHLYYQLYLLFLSRGGSSVPQKVASYGPPV